MLRAQTRNKWRVDQRDTFAATVKRRCSAKGYLAVIESAVRDSPHADSRKASQRGSHRTLSAGHCRLAETGGGPAKDDFSMYDVFQSKCPIPQNRKNKLPGKELKIRC